MTVNSFIPDGGCVACVAPVFVPGGEHHFWHLDLNKSCCSAIAHICFFTGAWSQPGSVWDLENDGASSLPKADIADIEKLRQVRKWCFFLIFIIV